jgi:predicted patatin/cPLA2 family phospholipase
MKNHPTVLEILSTRHINGFLGIGAQDNYKLGLIVEGGAMRSIVSCGMLIALKDLGMLKHFDSFIGSSGGSINLAYVLSGRSDKGIGIFYDHMVREKVVSPYRALPGGEQVVRMERLESIITNTVRYDDLELKYKYRDKFFVGVTNVDTLKGGLVKYGDSDEGILDYLIAGATIPIASKAHRKIKGHSYCDASLYYVDPILLSEESDCTHFLILRSKTHKNSYGEYARASKLQLKLLDKLKPEISSIYRSRLKYYQEALGTLSDEEITFRDKQLYSLTVGDKGHAVGRLTLDQWKLIEGAKAGYEAVLRLFSDKSEVTLIPKIVQR